MKHRISLWAAAGFTVAACWALYALPGMTSADPMMVLAEATCPIILFRAYPLSLVLVLIANSATYAILGLFVETLRFRFHHAQ